MGMSLMRATAMIVFALIAASAPAADAAKPVGTAKIRCTKIGKLKWCYAAKAQVDVVAGPRGETMPGDFPGQPTCAKLEAIPGLVTFSCEPI